VLNGSGTKIKKPSKAEQLKTVAGGTPTSSLVDEKLMLTDEKKGCP